MDALNLGQCIHCRSNFPACLTSPSTRLSRPRPSADRDFDARIAHSMKAAAALVYTPCAIFSIHRWMKIRRTRWGHLGSSARLGWRIIVSAAREQWAAIIIYDSAYRACVCIMNLALLEIGVAARRQQPRSWHLPRYLSLSLLPSLSLSAFSLRPRCWKGLQTQFRLSAAEVILTSRARGVLIWRLMVEAILTIQGGFSRNGSCK